MTRILVAYATKKGSTKEVAEAIAERLREHALDADVTPARGVRELAAYDGLVLGGSLYMGRWHGDALGLLKQQREAIAAMPFAVFAMGPMTMEESDVAHSRAQLDNALARTPEILPAAVAIFGGVLDPAEHRFPFSRMKASDARDWEAIRAWADEVAEALVAEVPVPA